MVLHIFEKLEDGTNGREYNNFDSDKVFFTKRFGQHHEDYKFDSVITSLTISFYKKEGDNLLTELLETKEKQTNVYLDDVFVFEGKLQITKVAYNNYHTTLGFNVIIQAKLIEFDPIFDFFSKQAGAYPYDFPLAKGVTMELTEYVETFFGYIGYKVAKPPVYTIIPLIDQSQISYDIEAQVWPCSTWRIANGYHLEKYTVWILLGSGEEYIFADDKDHANGQVFYWGSPELEVASMAVPMIGWPQRWFPKYSVNYSVAMSKTRGFTFTNNDTFHYTIGCTLVTNVITHYWSKNEYLGQPASAGCNFDEYENISFEMAGPICREIDLDPNGISGPIFTDCIFWIVAKNVQQTQGGPVIYPPPPGNSGSAEIDIMRPKASYTLPFWANKMRDTKNQDIFEILCREMKLYMVVDNLGKKVLWANTDEDLMITHFQEPVIFEWKMVHIKWDMTEECCYIKEVYSPDPDDLVKEYDLYYYTISFGTIISSKDFKRVKNHQRLNIKVGNYESDSFILSDIKNWNPESGLCTIIGYEENIVKRVYRSKEPNLIPNEIKI